MTGVPPEGTLALEELTNALALAALAGTVTEVVDEAEGVKWESLSELWEWRSGCGPEAAVLLLLLLPLAVLV